MDNASNLWKWLKSGKTALLILIILTILGPADRGWAGSGLDSPEPIGAYLNGKLPSKKPQSGAGSWVLVDAFPGLSFTNPLFMTPLPGSNKLVMIEHQGLVYTFDNNPATASKQLVLDIRGRVQDTHWGGLLSMAFHPQFGQSGSPNREYVYVAYRYEYEDLWESWIHQVPGYLRLSRFNYNFSTGQIDPNSELVMIQQYDTSKHHLGGSITFGNDGFLYLSRGDEYCCNDPTNATQKLNVGFFSGMLRIDVDMDASRSHPIRRQPQDNTGNRPAGWPASFSQGYYIPNDNPWQDPSGNLLEEFYAIGFRSPHVVSLDAPTGNIWIADVGESQREEIDLLKKGANFQWPFREGNIAGPKSKPGTVIGTETPPVAEYSHSYGNCIIGGHVYRGSQHASALGGKFLFADNGSQRVWAMTYNGGSGSIQELCVGPTGGYYTGISGSGRDANGEVYFLKMTGHSNGNGKIMKLSQSQPSQPEPPALLSQTGAFSNLATLAVSPGLLPYEVNTPLYSDGADKMRWFAIPNDGSHNSSGEKIGFSENGNWTFPVGAVLIKHFDLPIDEQNPSLKRRMETRFMIQGSDGEYFGFTYRWRPDGSDADLLYDGMDETVQVRKSNGTLIDQAWRYPSRTECFSCHSTAAGYVLGPRTRQLNGDHTYSKTGRTENQLETLNHLGIFSPAINPALLPDVLTSKPMGDASASWQKRALSYLDSNCSHCHQPGGTAHANFDARLSTSPFSQAIVGAIPNNNLGISGARIIAPGDNSRSVLYHRTNTLGAGAMPPLAKNHIDAGAINLLENWIATLDASVTPPSPSSSDVREPVATLSAPAQVGATFTVSVAFSETIYGLTTDDFAITNGAASGITGSGASYVLSVAVSGGANSVTVNLPSDRVIDAGSNANPPSNVVTSTVASLPVINIASASASEGSGTMPFAVTLSTASAAAVSVQYTTVANSATAPSDYQHSSGTLTIPAGNTSATLQLQIVDDLVDEPSETFTLQLSNASGATLGTASATGTIVDNDAAPSIAITDGAESESGSAVPFAINLSHASAFPVSVAFASVNGSAIAGSDYFHAAATVTFQPGQTSIDLGFGIARDTLDEQNEFFYVRLSSPVNATIGDAEGIGTIIDDDTTPTLSIAGGSAVESAGAISFQVQLSQPSGAEVQVYYESAARSATSGADYTHVSGTLTIPAGTTVANLQVAISNDSLDESDEDFSVTLSSPVNAVLGTSSAVGVILDDDETVLSIASAKASESVGSLVFNVQLSGATESPVFVNYGATSGTAEAPGDFQLVSGTLTIPAGATVATIAVTINDDSIFEIDETFTLTLSGVVNAILGQAVATGTIADNDPAPEITVAGASASELSGHVDLSVTLSAPSNGATAFDYQTKDGTAETGSDYVASSGTLTVPAGASQATITISLSDDQLIEQNETFSVVFANPQSGTLVAKSAAVTILDDEAGAQISIGSASADEGGAAVFNLSLSGVSAQDVSVTYALAAETATAGADFTPSSGVLVFPAGQQAITLSVPLLDNNVDEAVETFRVLLSNPINATLAVTSAQGSINDNDGPPTISVSPATAEEGDGSIEFSVRLDGESGLDITATYEVQPGSADAADFEARSGTVEISAGQTVATLSIPVTDDNMDEGAESLMLTLTGASNATIGSSEAVGIIFDDDQEPSISAAASSASESEEVITFQIALSERSGKDINVDWSVAGVTAAAGSDFVTASGTVTVPAGNQNATITVPLIEDDLPELTETLTLLLTNAESATISKATAVGTILDDDAIPTLSAIAPFVQEDAGIMEFIIEATTAHTVPMTVQVDVTSIVAKAGADFTAVSTVVEFAPGVTRAVVPVVIHNDTLDEGAESLKITLSSPSHATLGRSEVVGIIFDNDLEPEISVADATVGESGNVLVFPVSLSTESGKDVPIHWRTVSGSAEAGADFEAAEGELTIPAGTKDSSVSIALLDDNIFEENESFSLQLELTRATVVTLGRSVASGTIIDDETIPELAIDSSIVSEKAGNITFTISASNASEQPISVAYATAPGTADKHDFTAASGLATIKPGDTSATIVVAINDDESDEPNEAFRVVLTNPQNATLALARGIGTILDDDAPAAISVASATTHEAAGTLVFPVSLATISAFTVEVAYTVQNGTAEAGKDFEATQGVLEIAPGTKSAAIRVAIIDDALDEEPEDLSVVLSSPVRSQIEQSTAEGTIEDNDAAPEVAIESASGFESQRSLGLRVSLSAPSSKNISIDCLTRGDSATQGIDFHPETGPISIPAGGTSALIVVPLISDELNEPEETFEVILSNPMNATIVNAIGVGSILDDDEMPTLKIGNASIEESAGSIALPVTLSAPSGQRIQVNYTTGDFTATVGEDFVAAAGALVFEPGTTQAAVTVRLIDDKDEEKPEQLVVFLSDPSNATIDDGKGLGFIRDDDGEEDINETRPRALKAYSQGRLSWITDPDTGDRYLEYIVPNVPELERFDVTPQLSSNFTDWQSPAASDWYIEREGETIYAVIRARRSERSQYVRFVLTERE